MNRPHDIDAIPMALLKRRLRRQELLDEARSKEKRSALTVLFSGFRKRWFKTSPPGPQAA